MKYLKLKKQYLLGTNAVLVSMLVDYKKIVLLLNIKGPCLWAPPKGDRMGQLRLLWATCARTSPASK